MFYRMKGKREMIYTVLKIDEDLDYGCEERAEDQPVTALVTLRSPGGRRTPAECRISFSMIMTLTKRIRLSSTRTGCCGNRWAGLDILLQ